MNKVIKMKNNELEQLNDLKKGHHRKQKSL